MASTQKPAARQGAQPGKGGGTSKGGGRCPICRKPAEHATRPFCSSRCRDVDLGRWFGGSYTASRPLIDEDDIFSTDRLTEGREN